MRDLVRAQLVPGEPPLTFGQVQHHARRCPSHLVGEIPITESDLLDDGLEQAAQTRGNGIRMQHVRGLLWRSFVDPAPPGLAAAARSRPQHAQRAALVPSAGTDVRTPPPLIFAAAPHEPPPPHALGASDAR
jgi:hypothetical protein